MTPSDSDAPARDMADVVPRRTLLRNALAILTEIKTPDEAHALLHERYEIQTQKSDILIGADGCIERIVDSSNDSQFDEDNIDTVDCNGLLAIPGLIDTHRHLWQSLFKTIPADKTLFHFLTYINLVAASFITPEEAYVAQLCGAMEAINAGVTTVLDHFHLANSSDHVDAGFKALQHSGLRAVFAMGTNRLAQFPLADSTLTAMADAATRPKFTFASTAWQQECFESLASRRSSSSPLLITLALALDRWKTMAEEELNAMVATARASSVFPITLHLSNGAFHNGKTDEPLINSPLASILGPDILLSHANFLTDRELSLVAQKRVKLSATPEMEHHLNMGTSILEKAIKNSCCVGLGTDTSAIVEGSMFGVMRSSLAELRRRSDSSHPLSSVAARMQDVFLHATVGGAETLAGDKVRKNGTGLLAEGAVADIVLLDGSSYNMLGSLWTTHNDPVAAIVGQASIADVRHVFIHGRRLKFDGQQAPLSAEACANLHAIARKKGLDLSNNKCDSHFLLRSLAEKSAQDIFRRTAHVNLEAVRKQVGQFLNIDPQS